MKSANEVIILPVCPDAAIYSFDRIPVKSVPCEATEHYSLYKDFMTDRSNYLTRS